MPAVTRMNSKDVFYNVLESIEHSVALALTGCGVQVNTWRRVIGWAEPPEDCCPEIAVWGDNLRPDPAYNIQGGEQQRAGCANGWLYDVHIRVSECFSDTYDDGTPLKDDVLNNLSKPLYANLVWCAYVGWFCRWVNGQITEIDQCMPVTQGPLSTYATGGCAGIEFTITVALSR